MKYALWGALAGLALLSVTAVQAEVKPNALFSDGAVLQQGIRIPVFGTADEGEKVTVTFAGQTQSTQATGGRWQVAFKPMKTQATPLTMTIAGPGNTIKVKNLLVGEVYVCSGQSNMGFNLGSAATGPQAIAASADPQLRLFTVPNVTASTPQQAEGGQWQEAEPQTVPGFSAVAYFFGRDLRRALKLPVGLIHTSWGGTRAEAWTSHEMLQALNKHGGNFDADAKPQPSFAAQQATYATQLAEWQAAGSHEGPAVDAGNKGFAQGWAKPDVETADWQTMAIPQNWENTGLNIDGAVWFRKAVDVPAAWAGKDLTLSLGAIDDLDVTYFNGVQVGTTGMETPNWWAAPRKYMVPGAQVKAGRNVIAVRVFDQGGNGGMTGPADVMTLAPADGTGTGLSLAGDWTYKVEHRIIPKPAMLQEYDSNAPSVLYNAMIAPLIPYGIRGAIWYQGESNAGNPVGYATLFPAMIADWRQRWGEGNFPFFFVQLAPFMKIVTEPQDTGWAQLRESQRITALTVPNTGMAVITDVGDENNIHPTRKEPVGGRLALAALAIVYGKKIEGSGPVYQSMQVQGNKAILHFTHLGGGLIAQPGGPLTGWTIAGADRKYVNAQAVIQDNTVVVSSPQVPSPAAVRYGWADDPVVNFYNKAGLPASPFETDPFPPAK